MLPLALYTTADNFWPSTSSKVTVLSGFALSVCSHSPDEGFADPPAADVAAIIRPVITALDSNAIASDTHGRPAENARTPPSGYHGDEQAHQRQDGQLRAEKRPRKRGRHRVDARGRIKQRSGRNASVTTQDNRQSPSPSIHATLFRTGHPPERRGSKLPSSTFAPWANGDTPHVTEPISAVLGFETRLEWHNDVVTLNPKDPTVAASSCQVLP